TIVPAGLGLGVCIAWRRGARGRLARAPALRRKIERGTASVSHWPLLSLVTFLPLVGAAFILLARGEEAVGAPNAKRIALWTAVIVLALSILLWVGFDPQKSGFQFVERATWVRLGGFNVSYHLGIDGISLFFVLLSTLLTMLCVVSSWQSVHSQIREY